MATTSNVITVTIHADVRRFVQAMHDVQRATAGAARELQVLHRRMRNHPTEHPARSREHAAYRAKTRRRNRRRRNR